MNIKPIKNNLTEITTASSDQILVSYETPVAACIKGIYYATAKKWSKTTSRHLTFWLGKTHANEPVIKDQSFFDNLLTVSI